MRPSPPARPLRVSLPAALLAGLLAAAPAAGASAVGASAPAPAEAPAAVPARTWRTLTDAQLQAALPMRAVARLAGAPWAPGGGALADTPMPPVCPGRTAPRAVVAASDGVPTRRGDSLEVDVYRYRTPAAASAALAAVVAGWRTCTLRRGVLAVEGDGGTYWVRSAAGRLDSATWRLARLYTRDRAGTRVRWAEVYAVRAVGNGLVGSLAWRQDARTTAATAALTGPAAALTAASYTAAAYR